MITVNLWNIAIGKGAPRFGIKMKIWFNAEQSTNVTTTTKRSLAELRFDLLYLDTWLYYFGGDFSTLAFSALTMPPYVNAKMKRKCDNELKDKIDHTRCSPSKIARPEIKGEANVSYKAANG